MRHQSYIAIMGARDPFGARRMLEERAAAAGLELILKTAGLSVFSDRAATLTFADGCGGVLGRVWRNAPRMPEFVPIPGEEHLIAAASGDFLIDRCWGDYVAFLINGRGESVAIRPPFSDLVCVQSEFQGLHVAASCPSLVAHCTDGPLTPHWPMVANHIMMGGLRQSQSCLVGVEELLWGTRLVVGPTGSRIEQCWSPWRFAMKREGVRIEDLAEMIRQTAIETVGAMVRSLNHVAVMLSGGLDSSILAASVAANATRLTCLTLTSGDAIGDERSYAGLVTEALGVPLHAAAHRLDDVDIKSSHANGLVRPVARSFAQAARAAKQRLAQSVGAEVILDGGGGDNIFCSLQSATPVADRLLRGHFGRATLATAASIAALTETSLGKVFTLALRRLPRASVGYRWKVDERFLTPHALERAGPPSHAWLRAPAGSLPGSASHIAMIAVVEALLETSDMGLPERAPLMNQPLVELCLSIPSWLWFEHGHNRVVARRAFASDLPPEIVWRRSKGTPDGFVARVYEANRAELRTLLCDGKLAAEGLIDTDAISGLMSRPGPVKGHDHIRLLRIADVEAWIRGL